MRRLVFLAMAAGAALAASAVLGLGACSSATPSDRAAGGDDPTLRRDGGTVAPPEGGTPDAGAPAPTPSCTDYCALVMESCTETHAQYASSAECLAFCAWLPAGKGGESENNTLACRQFFAGSPARTDAAGYCLAAGPFGGGVCGDRCTAFCDLTLDACGSASAPYASYADCQTACGGFTYKDAGADGGGETPNGPKAGDTLNCRLYYARAAVRDGTGCANTGVDSGACR